MTSAVADPRLIELTEEIKALRLKIDAKESEVKQTDAEVKAAAAEVKTGAEATRKFCEKCYDDLVKQRASQATQLNSLNDKEKMLLTERATLSAGPRVPQEPGAAFGTDSVRQPLAALPQVQPQVQRAPEVIQSQRDQVLAALTQVLGPEVVTSWSWSVAVLDSLHQAGFCSERSLRIARDSTLKEIGVPPALRDMLEWAKRRQAQDEGAGPSGAGAVPADQSMLLEISAMLHQLVQLQVKAGEKLSFVASKASMAGMGKVCGRLNMTICSNLAFLDISEETKSELPKPVPPLFDWMGQSETTGGQRSRDWVQEHLAPKGVLVVLVSSEAWIDASWDTENVHIKASKTDLVFMLEESASLTGGLAGKLTYILGLCETKLTSDFSASSVAQGAAEHLGAEWKIAAHLHSNQIESRWPILTVVSDLRDNWTLISTAEPDGVTPKCLNIYNNAGDSSAGATGPAIRQAKKHLQDAANIARAALIARGLLRTPGGADSSGSGGADEGKEPEKDPPVLTEQPASSQGMVTRNHARLLASSSAGGHQSQKTSTHSLGYTVVPLPASGAPMDSDMEREFDAAYSADLVSLLRDPLGYKGLLGLCSPPTSIQHPALSELAEGPWMQDSQRIIAAYRQGIEH